MTVSGKDKRGLVEELRTLRTRLDRLERRNAELMQAEHELRESLEQFKTMFDDSPVGLYRTTPDGRVLMANSALVNMLGYSSFDELARRNLENEGYEPQYPRSMFKERIEREGKVIGMESAWKRSDGTTLYIRESAQAVRDGSGRTLYYEGTVEDITEYRQTKDTLHASEEKFGILARNLSEGMDIVDENLRCLFANPAGEKIFGVEPGGLVGRTLYEFISDESHALVEELLNKRREGIASSYDLEIIRPDGQKRQLIVTGTPRFSEDGKYIGGMGLFFDVTEKKQAEQALRKAHDELEIRVQQRTAELQQANEALCKRELSLNLALQVANLGHWDWDMRSNRTQCSDEIYRIFDVRPEEVQFTYERFLEFAHPSDRESIKMEVQAVQQDNRLLDMEFRIITPAGRERAIHCRAAIFRNQTGEPVRMIGTTQDITERRQAEREICERARIIDSTTDSVIKTDRGGVVTMWNRGAERIFGYTSGEMLGQPISTLYSEQEQGRLGEIIETLLRGEEIATAEVTCVHKNGSQVELALSLLPFMDDNRNVTNFVGISKDITDLKKAQEALRQSENRYRTVIENAGEGIVVVQDGMLRFVNSRHTFITGRSEEESTSRPFIEFVHPDDRRRVAEIHAARLRGEQVPPVYEFRIIDKDGRTRWLENNGVVIEWNGKPASLNFIRNVTERKNAEEALREREEMIRALVETSRDWIWSIDVNGVHTYCNPAVEQILGYSPDKLVGKHSLNLIHDDDRKMVEANLPTWIAEKRGWNNLMLRWRHKDGTYRYLESNAMPILSSEDKLVGFRGVDRDITDRKKAQDELREKSRLQQILLDSMPCVALLLRPGSREIVASNKAAAEVGAVPGKTCYQTWAKNDSPCPWCLAPEVWATGQPRHCEPTDGEKIWDAHWIPVSDDLYMHYAFDVSERQQAEKTLCETTALLETIFAHTHILVAYLDPQFNFVRVNRAYAQADEQEPSFFAGRNHFDLYPNAENEAIFHKVVEIGVPYFAQAKPFDCASHSRRGASDYDWSLVPIKSQDGVVSGLILTLVNVTEQKMAEQALRKSEERFRQFFENEPEYCYMVSPEGTILDLNAAALKALGRTKDELLGQPIRHIYAPESLPKITALFEKWKCGESIQNEELIVLAKDGTQRTVLLSASFVRDSSGRIMHSVSVQRDITELKRAEQTLREREATLTSLFRAAPVGIGLEQDRVLARVNDTICQMLGYSRDELVGRHAKMFYTGEEDYQRVREEKHRQILERGTATVETRWKRKDGRIIDVLLNATVLDPADFAKGVTFTALDITERKAAEEAIRESEEKFRTLAEQSPNMIFINKKGRIIYANRKCEEIMGYTREEFYCPDFDFRALVAPESADVIRESFTRHLQGHEVEPYECCFISKAGERIEAIHASKLIQYEGETAILGIVTDITERKKAEQALRESQERLAILFESAPDAIYVTDLDGRFVDGNRAAEELVGFAKADLVGKSLAESGLLSADDVSKAAANLRKVTAGQSSGPTEYTVRRKSGSLIAVEVRTFPVTIGGRILSLGIARDITARKHAEEAIKASEKKFRSIFETAANLITSVNEQGIIVDCNDRVREFLGYEKEEILGRPMSRIIHPDYLDKAQTILKEILTQGFSYNEEYRMVRKDGSLVDVSINSSAIEDEHGKYTRTLCIIDDITGRKQFRQKLLDDREQLKSLASQLSLTEERERRRLATVLHDHIGQSLVFSKIKLDQMRKSGSAGELTEALKDVSRCLGQVIQETRTLTFDLSDPILYELGFEAAVAEWLTEQVQEKHGFETEFQDDGQVKPLDEDIRALLFRNVREVLINIIKHAQARHVKVAVGKADKSICVSVEDDGVGFDPVEVAATAVKKAEFGLFSIRERLEQLGGRVEIESKPGRGTKVTMIAPLKYELTNDGT